MTPNYGGSIGIACFVYLQLEVLNSIYAIYASILAYFQPPCTKMKSDPPPFLTPMRHGRTNCAGGPK